MKSHSTFTQIIVICTLFCILAATGGLAADEPTLTIDTIEGTGGVIKIYYTSTGESDEKLVTTGWQYSINDGKTWTTIDEAAIGNNKPKPHWARRLYSKEQHPEVFGQGEKVLGKY